MPMIYDLKEMKCFLQKNRKGQPLFTEKDIDDMIRSLDRKADSIEAKARKHERYAKQLLSKIEKLKVKDLKR